jgi:hypothetical protein
MAFHKTGPLNSIDQPAHSRRLEIECRGRLAREGTVVFSEKEKQSRLRCGDATCGCAGLRPSIQALLAHIEQIYEPMIHVSTSPVALQSSALFCWKLVRVRTFILA